jgi:DNA modification methylase
LWSGRPLRAAASVSPRLRRWAAVSRYVVSIGVEHSFVRRHLYVSAMPTTLATSLIPTPADGRERELKGTTSHLLRQGDARDLSWLPDESVHLVVTSPPYGLLKRYSDAEGQLGNGDDPTSVDAYIEFLDELDRCWAECQRVLVPGGRVCCVVGDICLSRRAAGRHHVLPLASDIQVRARDLGLDNLTPIRWLKVANVKLEASNSSFYLGKPNLPNGIVKNDVETIVMMRKPGYRKPTSAMEEASHIATDEYRQLFTPFWADIPGEQSRRYKHPAPYPEELSSRLIRMYSFVEDTVLDPFVGSGTTIASAIANRRNSIGVEIVPEYVEIAAKRLHKIASEEATVVADSAPKRTKRANRPRKLVAATA